MNGISGNYGIYEQNALLQESMKKVATARDKKTEKDSKKYGMDPAAEYIPSGKADEAVKATNTEIIAIELPRDTKGGAGHGSLIIFGAQDVSDVRRAVEVTLDEVNNRVFGDVYGNEAGHVELDYTARASYACNKGLGAPIGKSFGTIVGAPAAIGLVMADTALKAANVEVVSYCTPGNGTSFSNEVILNVSGDSGAVRQAVIAAREVGIKLLSTLGSEPVNSQPSYI